jgi:DNA-binding LacI/PurR family transcriptional regulator
MFNPKVAIRPPYSSLADQVAVVLRRGISERIWVGRLASERSLAVSLGVSRRTLRNAIYILQREGVLTNQSTQRHTINPLVSKTRIKHEQLRIAILTPHPLSELRPFTTIWINEIRALCLGAGVEISIISQPKCYGEKGVRMLDRLVRSNPHNCWIPLYSNAKMQRWFAAKKIPCLLPNACYSGVDLPDLDNDQRATARHTANHLLFLGHRIVAFVTEGTQRGDLMEAEIGFRAAFSGKMGSEAEPIVVSYKEFTVPEVVRSLETLFRRARRPTAVIVTNSQAYPLTLSFLAQKGLKIPRDVSLVATTDDMLYAHLLPSPAHYQSISPVVVAKYLYRMASHIARGEPLVRRHVRLTTTFVKGGSIGVPSRNTTDPSRTTAQG